MSIASNFLLFDEIYRKARRNSRDKLSSCHWCGHDFVDGEMVALANAPDQLKNFVLCQDCATIAGDIRSISTGRVTGA